MVVVGPALTLVPRTLSSPLEGRFQRRRFLLCLLCNRRAGRARRLPGTRRMEVRSQISFRRGRTSFHPSSGPSLPAAWISFPSLRGSLSFFLELVSGPHRLSTPPPPPPPSSRRGLLETIARSDVSFSTFSRSVPVPPSVNLRSSTFARNAAPALFFPSTRSRYRSCTENFPGNSASR